LPKLYRQQSITYEEQGKDPSIQLTKHVKVLKLLDFEKGHWLTPDSSLLLKQLSPSEGAAAPRWSNLCTGRISRSLPAYKVRRACPLQALFGLL